MAADDLETLATLNYNLHEGYYRHVQMIALDATRKYGSDSVLSFYKGLGLLCENQLQEATRELELVKDKQNVTIGAHIALCTAYSKARNPDRSSIDSLEMKINDLKRNSTDLELYFAVVAIWFSGGSRSPKEYLDKIKANDQFKQGLVLKGWFDLRTDREILRKKSIKYFDQGQDDPFGILGKAKYNMHYGKKKNALEAIHQVNVAFPNFVPGYVERIRVYIQMQNWDQMFESTQRLLKMSPHHPEGLRMELLYTLGREGKYSDAVNKLGELIQVIDRFEPQNDGLYYLSGKLFSRMCGRNLPILNQTYTLIERAASLNPTSAEYAYELGMQLLLMDKLKDCRKCFDNAAELDSSYVLTLIGRVRCQLIEFENMKSGDPSILADAHDSIDFLESSISDNLSEVWYLKVLHARCMAKSQEEILKFAVTAWENHMNALAGGRYGIDFFMKVNPDLVMELVKEVLRISPSQPILSGQAISPALSLCKEMLEVMTKHIPGLLEALYSYAKVLFLSGDSDTAMSTLKHCLAQDSTYGDAHLLTAQIYQHLGNYKATEQYLETALGFNFEIRDHPLYLLVRARSLRHSDRLPECIQALKQALSLPGIKRPVSAIVKQNRGKKAIAVENNDRLSIFLELVDAHLAANEQHEAAKVMQDAMNAFQGTPEEIRVRVANSELAVKRGEVEQALSILRGITPEQPYYVQAKEQMAAIYLNHKRDPKLYTSCYRDLVEKQPTAHSLLLLGDAYIKVQEPEKAIEVYEKALKRNPKDGKLASKIGQALIKTHDFKKAITYYETALKNGQQGHLRFELADLLLKLKHFTKAERVLQQNVDNENGNVLESSINETKRLMLLATLCRENQRNEDEISYLTQARDTQARVLKRIQVEQPDSALGQKRLAADICCKMSDHSKTFENNIQQAIKYRKEALIYCENDAEIMVDLARLYLQTGELDSCQQYCMQALRLSSDGNDQASMMMADVMYSKKQYQDAIYHYQQLLDLTPDHYEALARLITLLRRGGELGEANRFISQAEEIVGKGRTQMDAGFQYCKGLYEWYCGKAQEALQLFNRARCDSDWNEKAVENMIRICLNPDQQTLGGEVFENLHDSTSDKSSSGNNSALSTAERLVKEFKSHDVFKVKFLENMVLVTTKHKPHAEKALSSFVDICKQKQDYVPALLGMAIAYQILKQTPRARNQLKRISKMQWSSEEAEDFERAWLLLSDLYITAGKYDMATELLNKCLAHNKSCCKAYEYKGFIFEKEQSYKDASDHYEKAWSYSNKSNPVIGYKLAFNYLKAKRNVEAIDVAHQVLSQNPNYPRVKKEILDKARAGIRV